MITNKNSNNLLLSSLFKLIFPIFILFSNNSLNAQGKWEWSNPKTTANNLNSVKFINSTVGFAVGQLGTVLKTTDGGINWVILSSGTLRNLNSVCFINNNIGIAVGDSGTIIKTTNGGLNWTTQVSGTSVKLNTVCFVDSSLGYVGGNGCVILTTQNAGASWVI